MRSKKPLTIQQALEEMRRYCDKSERCESEVIAKVRSWGFTLEEAMEVHAQLIIQGFVSERRYAEAYAHDKFKFNRWGQRKIEMELRRKGISARNIKDALARLEKEDELAIIRSLIQKKEPQLKGLQLYQKRIKLMRYLLSKGFETGQITEQIQLYLGTKD
jgi:regulatory protein